MKQAQTVDAKAGYSIFKMAPRIKHMLRVLSAYDRRSMRHTVEVLIEEEYRRRGLSEEQLQESQVTA